MAYLDKSPCTINTFLRTYLHPQWTLISSISQGGGDLPHHPVHTPDASGYPPRPSSDANHSNRLLVYTLQLLLTPRLVDIFHNNLLLLLVDTFRVPMVGNTLHNNLFPSFRYPPPRSSAYMVVDTFLWMCHQLVHLKVNDIILVVLIREFSGIATSL